MGDLLQQAFAGNPLLHIFICRFCKTKVSKSNYACAKCKADFGEIWGRSFVSSRYLLVEQMTSRISMYFASAALGLIALVSFLFEND